MLNRRLNPRRVSRRLPIRRIRKRTIKPKTSAPAKPKPKPKPKPKVRPKAKPVKPKPKSTPVKRKPKTVSTSVKPKGPPSLSRKLRNTQKGQHYPGKSHLKTLPLSQLCFGQQHSHSYPYFRKKFGDKWCKVDTKDAPHTSLYLGNRKDYTDYVKSSWGYHQNNLKWVQFSTNEQYRLLAEIKRNGITTPVEVVKTLFGKYCIVHGNHRVGCAVALGISKVRCRIVDRTDYIKHFAKVKSTYGTGTGKGAKPYQTFYDLDKNVLLKGRRTNILTRHNIIKQHIDFKGKSVLDFGGNYGNASVLAASEGACSAHVVDYDKDVITAAVRLGVLIGAEQLHYYVGNLRQYIRRLPVCDIGYCFSITHHVKELSNLCKMIRDKVRDVLVYETHEGMKMEPVIRKLFKTIKFIGEIDRRKLYICYKAKQQ